MEMCSWCGFLGVWMTRILWLCSKERLAGFDGGWVRVARWADSYQILSMAHGTCACVPVCKQRLSVAHARSAPTLVLQHNRSSRLRLLFFKYTLCNYCLRGSFCSEHTQPSLSATALSLRKWKEHHIRGRRSSRLPLIFKKLLCMGQDTNTLRIIL